MPGDYHYVKDWTAAGASEGLPKRSELRPSWRSVGTVKAQAAMKLHRV